jgi:hypothetical protein
VWVSIIGGTTERSATLVALDHAMVFIRRELGTRLRLKRIPDLHVRLDDSIERGTRILQVIDAIETGGLPGDPPAGESLPTPIRGAAPGGAGAEGADAAALEAPVADPGEGFGAAAAEYAASLAASLAARRDARRPGKTGGRSDPRSARPGSRGARSGLRGMGPDRRGEGGQGRGPGGGR